MFQQIHAMVQNNDVVGFYRFKKSLTEEERTLLTQERWKYLADIDFSKSYDVYAEFLSLQRPLPNGEELVESILTIHGGRDSNREGRQIRKEILTILIRHVCTRATDLIAEHYQRMLLQMEFQPAELLMHYFHFTEFPVMIDLRAHPDTKNAEFYIELLYHSAATGLPDYHSLTCFGYVNYTPTDIINSSLIMLKVRGTVDVRAISKNVLLDFYAAKDTRDLGQRFLHAIIARDIPLEGETNYYSRILEFLVGINDPAGYEFLIRRGPVNFFPEFVDRVWPAVVHCDNDVVCQYIISRIPSASLAPYVEAALLRDSPRIHQLFFGNKAYPLPDSIVRELVPKIPLKTDVRLANTYESAKPLVLERIDQELANLTQLRQLLE